jgi:hypothetical protein
MTRRLILTLLVSCLLLAVSAQSNGVKDLLQKVQTAYRRPSYLGFKVRYMYTNDNQPGRPVDTLSGSFEMDKGRTLFSIPGTVSLVTDAYAVQVLTEDKLIYISRTRTANPIDPASSLDSLMNHLDRVRATVSGEVLTLTFPPGQPYTQVQMTIDTVTGYIRVMTYDLYTAGFVDRDQLDRPGHQGPYQPKGRVTILFTQYETGRFGDDAFDAGRYFTHVGTQFQPTAPYKDYHIFLASSHL